MTDIEMNEEMLDQDLGMTELELAAMEEICGGKSTRKFLKTTTEVYVRRGAGVNHTIMGKLSKGSIVSYLGTSKKDDKGVKWYKINYDGLVGWICSKYCKVI